jgi:hypothetical protein
MVGNTSRLPRTTDVLMISGVPATGAELHDLSA